MHTDRREVICEHSRLSAAGDWERYTAQPLVKAVAAGLSAGFKCQVYLGL